MSQRKPKLSGWLAASAAAAALLILALLAWVGLRAFVFSSLRARLEADKLAFLDAPAAIEPGSFDPPRFDAATAAASARADAEWEKLGGDEIQAPEELRHSGAAYLQIALEDRPDSILAESTRAFVRRADAFTSAVSALAARPDYTLDALPASTIDRANLGPNIRLAEWAAALLEAQAKLDADSGRWDDALSKGVAALRIARPGAATYLSEGLTIRLIASRAAASLAILARRCDDPASIRAALADLQSLETALFPPAPADPLASHFVSGLRRARASGFKPKLPASPTGRDLAAEFLRWQSSLAPSPEGAQRGLLKRAVIASSAGFPLRGSEEWIAAMAVDMKLARPDAATAYLLSMPDGDYLRAQSRGARASFDMTLLNVAARLFEIENGGPPTGIAEIVPRYLRAAPVDPESGKPYAWSEATGRFARKSPAN